MKRRRFLATGVFIGGIGVTGCLGKGENTIGDGSGGEAIDAQGGSDEDETRDCEIATREAQGLAEPIEESEPISVFDGETETGACGYKAAGVAIDYLDEQLAVELDDAAWIQPGYSVTYDQALVSVYATGRDGEIMSCPASDWDFEEALEALPAELALTVTDEAGKTRNECSQPVVLTQTTIWED